MPIPLILGAASLAMGVWSQEQQKKAQIEQMKKQNQLLAMSTRDNRYAEDSNRFSDYNYQGNNFNSFSFKNGGLLDVAPGVQVGVNSKGGLSGTHETNDNVFFKNSKGQSVSIEPNETKVLVGETPVALSNRGINDTSNKPFSQDFLDNKTQSISLLEASKGVMTRPERNLLLRTSQIANAKAMVNIPKQEKYNEERGLGNEGQFGDGGYPDGNPDDPYKWLKNTLPPPTVEIKSSRLYNGQQFISPFINGVSPTSIPDGPEYKDKSIPETKIISNTPKKSIPIDVSKPSVSDSLKQTMRTYGMMYFPDKLDKINQVKVDRNTKNKFEFPFKDSLTLDTDLTKPLKSINTKVPNPNKELYSSLIDNAANLGLTLYDAFSKPLPRPGVQLTPTPSVRKVNPYGQMGNISNDVAKAMNDTTLSTSNSQVARKAKQQLLMAGQAAKNKYMSDVENQNIGIDNRYSELTSNINMNNTNSINQHKLAGYAEDRARLDNTLSSISANVSDAGNNYTNFLNNREARALDLKKTGMLLGGSNPRYGARIAASGSESFDEFKTLVSTLGFSESELVEMWKQYGKK